ncbi:zinc-binding dehydrogenase [Aestuariivirga sp.]|uniref:zinc-binding dehydrogenase n=1 Tax=Aestuariivirga sp. TaxID=2650926 RepID=UPI0039E2B5A2
MDRALPNIPDSMQAIVCHGPMDYRFETVPVPQPGPGEVLAKIRYAGVCASDLKCWLGAPMFWGTAGAPGGYCQPPVIAGHEFIAEVAALGDGTGERDNLQIGDRVISEQIVPCRSCRYCRDGYYWMCEINDVYGFRQATPGAWAEYMLFPPKAINHRVPKTIPLHHAVFIEPLACAIHAVNQGNIQLNDTVVIAGCGPLGLGMIAAAKMKGAAQIIAVDLVDERLAAAREVGADVGLNPKKSDAAAEIRKLTGGYGCDVYIEATGSPDGVAQGLDAVRKMGTFVEFSVFTKPASVDWTIIGDRKELTIRGSHLSPHCYPTAMRMLERGLLPMDRILTHRFPLSACDDAIALVKSGASSVKVVFEIK